MDKLPTTLQDAIVFFSDPDNCLNYAVSRRWPNGVCCPTCGSTEVKFLPTRRLWECKNRHPRKQFSFKVGTIFEDSPISLDKWFVAMWMLANCKNGVSSYEIHRAIGVTQKSAWFMLHRIRLAMETGSFKKFAKTCEVDETFVGGKSKNMHAKVRARRITGSGGKDKTIVMGILERGGEVRATVVEKRSRKELQAHIMQNVKAGARVYTDALPSYDRLHGLYMHEAIDHAVEYVRGNVHVNGMENFWSLLKRGLKGTYVAVDPEHLNRYVVEQVFRFNNRKDLNDGGRFNLAMKQVEGKRLTYAELTGKTDTVRH
ncbi:MAG: IS1595 family transposase [Nevskia sp.]|nr:IS1595 family transposase [Nevskia sp.]